MHYTINELPTYKEICKGLKYGLNSVLESDSKDDIIAEAEDFFCNKSLDNGEYGDGELEVFLITHNDDGEIIAENIITITWFGECNSDRIEHSTLWGLS